MRQHKRSAFGVSFVMIVGAAAAGCGGHKPEPIHGNPPAPQMDAGTTADSGEAPPAEATPPAK